MSAAGRAAFIGLGFADRGDSFDLLVSIQDHFKYDTFHCSLFRNILYHFVWHVLI